MWLLESPSKLKFLECTTNNSWRPAMHCRKPQGHHIVFLHMNIHTDSSFDKGKCDESVGSKDSTFSSTGKNITKDIGFDWSYCGILGGGCKSKHSNVKMICLFYRLDQHLFVVTGMAGQKKMIMSNHGTDGFGVVQLYVSPWYLVLGRV